MPSLALSYFRKQQPVLKRWMAGVFAATSVLCAVGALNILAVRASAPKPIAAPPTKRMRPQDEAALYLRILQENAKYATHVGIAHEKYAIDPDPAVMRILRAKVPGLRPVSDLVEPGTRSSKKRFHLTVAGVRCTDANKAEVGASHYSSDSYSMGSFSHQSYTATRDKADRTQWRLTPGALGCGFWDQVPIKTPKGTVQALIHERNHPK